MIKRQYRTEWKTRNHQNPQTIRFLLQLTRKTPWISSITAPETPKGQIRTLGRLTLCIRRSKKVRRRHTMRGWISWIWRLPIGKSRSRQGRSHQARVDWDWPKSRHQIIWRFLIMGLVPVKIAYNLNKLSKKSKLSLINYEIRIIIIIISRFSSRKIIRFWRPRIIWKSEINKNYKWPQKNTNTPTPKK